MEKQPTRVAQIVGKMVGGGVESFIMNYYRNIDKTKIQFDFIIDSDSTHVPKEEIEKMGGRIIEVPPYQKIFSYINALTKIFKENEYKIVHSHINTLSVFPLFCAFISKIPVRIAHAHSTTNKKEFKRNIIKNCLRPFSKVFATDYFACSEHSAIWQFGKNAFLKGRVTLIKNAIDVDKFKYDEKIRKKIRKELQIEKKFVIGHVGRFVQTKNHDFLVDIFKEIYIENNNAVLLLIGDGPLENVIKEKVNKMGLKEAVYFLGTKDNVNEIMQAMDVFVFPSLYEGLGLVFIEAQCSGLHCVTSTNVPKEAILIKENCDRFNLSDSILEWKEGIVKNKYSRNDYSELIIHKKYSIKNEVNSLTKIYLEKVNEIHERKR